MGHYFSLELHWIKLVSISRPKFKCLCLVFRVPSKPVTKEMSLHTRFSCQGFRKETDMFFTAANHAALCCFKLLKLCYEEALNCLKGQGLKWSIAQLYTRRFRFQIWPSYHPKAGAASRSSGANPVPSQKRPGFPRLSLGRPSLCPRFSRKRSGAGPWEVPLSIQGDPVSPKLLPHLRPAG